MEEYSLKKFLKSPLPIKYLPYTLIILGFLGFVDAVYLTIDHYKNFTPPCTIHGCETVLTSTYATVAHIPIAMIGAGFYLVVIVLGGILVTIQPRVTASKAKQSHFRHPELVSGSQDKEIAGHARNDELIRTIINVLFILTGLGLLVGIVLVGIQAFVLHAFCQYCLFSELIDFLLFDTAWWLYYSSSMKS